MDFDTLRDKFGSLSEGFGKGLLGVFGSKTQREVRKLEPLVRRIAELEPWAQGLSAEQFHEQTAAWKKAVAAGELALDDIQPEAFAMVREAAVRTLGMRHFDVQLVGGIALHDGKVAEMATGEGKTLMATLALYLNCLGGKPCYLVTVNDYLARRDATWMSPLYEYLGVTVAAIQAHMSSAERLPVYASDIVYGTNNEFGFDYLRDNMKTRLSEQVQRDLAYAIIDEVDSILIDEARTPLIISGPAELTPDKYRQADDIAKQLVIDEDFEVKEKERSATLKEEGIVKAQELLGVESFYDTGHMDWPHYIENALRARNLYHRDQEYVVEEGQVVIVDEFTGRKMAGRRWSDGLHQAVEAKEGLRIRQENQTLATITFQNYFRLYSKLAGMTGTAITEAEEFFKIYGLEVIQVPTNKPIVRADQQDVVYRTEGEKWNAIVEEIQRVHEKGQPVLVGTTSVENSEKVAELLVAAEVPHHVLNAKHHEREAEYVAMAGQRGAVTVSTNMAGRGTDIKLGGNFEHRLAQALEATGLSEGDPEHLEAVAKIRDEVRAQCDRDEEEVLELGGLYVLGTERHESRRIDNQLRGRSGRQGNAGETRFFLSLQDPLMKRFYKDWVTNFMEKLGMKEGVPIESGMVSRAIQRAQKKVEEYYFEIRKNLIEYDEVMDEQRKRIYDARQDVLEGVGLDDRVIEMVERVVSRTAMTFEDDAEGFADWFKKTFGKDIDRSIAEQVTEKDADPTPAVEAAEAIHLERKAEMGEKELDELQQYVLLNTIDTKWKDHLHAVDALKQGIGLRGYAQKDPKNEYKAEAFALFERLFESIEDEVASLVLRVRFSGGEDEREESVYGSAADPTATSAPAPAPAPGAAAAPQSAGGGTATATRPARPARPNVPARQAFDRARRTGEVAPAAAPSAATDPRFANVGRNDECPCGSGKKFKKCHGQV
ncbi:preprotein translocase subunit SecA [Planctomycetes bacterium Pla163]|uniref:Protein translocase subunit SecA n=1 Tax=Rohdeia mirabilis TaxID=2528008 RepID=A0A518D157_9BACT|nr:preprotein translocase subunit SecA [Planctomycetes bacterium Pla163]